MKNIKTFEKFNNNYKKGDYIVVDRDLYSYGDISFTKGAPYEIVGIIDDEHNQLIVLINNNNEKVGMNDFDDRIRKISKKEAEFILNQMKYNL